MIRKKIICTVCPQGCLISAAGTKEEVAEINGYACKKGKEYGIREFLHPVRILTTTVRIYGGRNALLPVRSASSLPKELLTDCMDVIKKTSVSAPIARYDVIIPNVCGCGADIVATDGAEKM
jgi:CxxC motif-containing protein